MGQYHYTVNLDKKEFINPHPLGSGLKLWEQLANPLGPGAALIVLLAASNGRGGGDFDTTHSWHGPERQFPEHNTSAPATDDLYRTIAERTIGRWAGDRIAIVGDYAEPYDLPAEYIAQEIYNECQETGTYKDITPDVARIIEHELCGRFEGNGWKEWKPARKEETP